MALLNSEHDASIDILIKRFEMASIATDKALLVQDLQILLDLVTHNLRVEKKQYDDWVAPRLCMINEINEMQRSCFLLDIGGQPFHVSLDSLLSGRSRYLAVVASDIFASEIEADGHLFIDRDPLWFPIVLAYVRMDLIILPDSHSQRHAIHREAVYYQVDGLAKGCMTKPYLICVKGDEARTGKIQVYDIWADKAGVFQCPFPKTWHICGCCANDNYFFFEVCFGAIKNLKAILVQYFPRTEHYKILFKLPSLMDCCAMISIGNSIIMLGRSDYITGSNTLWLHQYDVDCGKWYDAVPVEGFALRNQGCVVDDRPVFADYLGQILTCTLDRCTGQWLPSRIIGRMVDVGVFSECYGWLMAIGYSISWQLQNHMDFSKLIDPENGDVVADLPLMSCRRGGGKAVCIADRIFVIGGGKYPDNSAELLHTSPMDDHWTPVALPFDSNALFIFGSWI